MLADWWLAIAGLPVFLQPMPEAPEVPAAVALASGQVSRRLPCYRLNCGDAEWMQASASRRLAATSPPGLPTRIAPVRPARLATRRFISLYSPASKRDWFYTTGSNARVGATYVFEPVRSPDARLQMEFGTGYRLEPYSDYGTRSMGPIARGRMQFSQKFGDFAVLSQQLQVETGRENTYARQIIGLDLHLYPQWTLRSDLILRHDTAANGGDGRTDRERSLRLRYTF